MNQVSAIVGTAVLGIVGIVLLSFLLSWPVYMLWNGCLVDAVEGARQITWLQAWGLNILFGIMFKPSSVSKKD